MKELKKQWKNHEFARCYLFYGEESYLARLYEKNLAEALLPTGAEMMNHDIFMEKTASAAAIMDAAETLPFLNEKRLVTVRNSEFFQKGNKKEEGERLVAFLDTLPESTCLLFVEEKVEKNNRLYKAVVKNGEAVEFKAPSEKELVAWIKKECKNGGTAMEDSVALHFLQTVDSGMEAMEGELQKLIAYKNGESPITAEDVAEVCTVSLEAKVFDLVRAVAEQRPERAMTVYRHLLLLKESPYMVLSLITRQFRFILVSMLFSKDGLSNQEIAEKIGVRDFAVREYVKQSKRFPEEIWKEALKDCLKADLNIKTGMTVEETAVELLIMKYSGKLVAE